jgi:hypothetical protein
VESVRDLNRCVLDVPVVGVDALGGRLLFALCKTDEGKFVWILEVVGGGLWRRTRLEWGAGCDRCGQHRREHEEAGKELTCKSTR